MSQIQNFLNFKPAGPVAASFLGDRDHDVRALLGPVGGGKSVCCVYDCLRNASMMPPCNDGVIRYRIAIIGATYGQIEKNLMPTWFAWLPGDGGTWTEGDFKGGGGRLGIHKLRWKTQRNGRWHEVHFEAIFAAIGDNNVEQFMRGFEPTAFWLYEMDLLVEDVLDQALFRIGRYPATGSDGNRPEALPPGVDFRSYVIGDLNAPDIDSWFYSRFEEDVPPGHKVYKQPSGRSARAENVQNLPKGYYDRQVGILEAKRNGKHLVRRMVDALYGPTLAGEPVWPNYSDELHLAPGELAALKGVPLLLGFDQEIRNPACLIAQQDPKTKQYRYLAEVVPGRMGPSKFAELVEREIQEVAPGCDIEGAWSDPAGFAGSDREGGDFAWTETVSHVLGIPILPAPTNELNPRIDAVSDELDFELAPGVRGIIVSRRCKMLRKAMASHYYFETNEGKARADLMRRRDPKPIQNPGYSDIACAAQYLQLGHKGLNAVTRSKLRDGAGRLRMSGVPKKARPSRLKSNFDVLA